MTVVYVAGPIDQAGDIREAWDHWGSPKSKAREFLANHGIEVYDPASAWRAALVDPGHIQRVNNYVLDLADGVLAFLPQGVPTIGTPIEIARARGLGKPVVVIGGEAARLSPVLVEMGVDWVDESRSDRVNYAVTQLVTLINERAPVIKQSLLAAQTYVGAVVLEVARAAKKFPDNTGTNTHNEWFAIFMEEVVEFCQAYNDWQRTGTSVDQAVTELEQVGAMAARLHESLKWG